MGGADGGDDLLRFGRHVQVHEFLRQGLTQADIARRLTVLQRERLQTLRVGDPPNCRWQKRVFQPVGRENAHAGLGPVAAAMKHAADQGRGADRHMLGVKTTGSRQICYRIYSNKSMRIKG